MKPIISERNKIEIKELLDELHFVDAFEQIEKKHISNIGLYNKLKLEYLDGNLTGFQLRLLTERIVLFVNQMDKTSKKSVKNNFNSKYIVFTLFFTGIIFSVYLYNIDIIISKIELLLYLGIVFLLCFILHFYISKRKRLIPHKLNNYQRDNFIKYLYHKYSQSLEQIGDDRFLISQKFNYTLKGASILEKHRIEKHKNNLETNNTFKDLTTIHSYLILLGEPGSGKTSILLQYSLDLLKENKLPIVFDLSTWSGKKNIEIWMKNILTQYYDYPTSLAHSAIEKNEIVFIFDGLDEIGRRFESSEKYSLIRGFIEELYTLQSKKNPPEQMILVSRTTVYNQLDTVIPADARIEIVPNSFLKIKSELLNICENTNQKYNRANIISATNILSQFDKNNSIKIILTIPYYFNSLMQVFNLPDDKNMELPQHQTELKSFLDKLFIDRKLSGLTKYSKKKVEIWLRWLAEWLFENNKTSFIISDFNYTIFTKDTKLEEKYRLSQIYTILILSIIFWFYFADIGLILSIFLGVIPLIIWEFIDKWTLSMEYSANRYRIDNKKIETQIIKDIIVSGLNYSILIGILVITELTMYIPITLILASYTFTVNIYLMNKTYNFSFHNNSYSRLLKLGIKNIFPTVIFIYLIVVSLLEQNLGITILAFIYIILYVYKLDFLKFLYINKQLSTQNKLPFLMVPFFYTCVKLRILKQFGDTWLFRHYILHEYFLTFQNEEEKAAQKQKVNDEQKEKKQAEHERQLKKEQAEHERRLKKKRKHKELQIKQTQRKELKIVENRRKQDRATQNKLNKENLTKIFSETTQITLEEIILLLEKSPERLTEVLSALKKTNDFELLYKLMVKSSKPLIQQTCAYYLSISSKSELFFDFIEKTSLEELPQNTRQIIETKFKRYTWTKPKPKNVNAQKSFFAIAYFTCHYFISKKKSRKNYEELQINIWLKYLISAFLHEEGYSFSKYNLINSSLRATNKGLVSSWKKSIFELGDFLTITMSLYVIINIIGIFIYWNDNLSQIILGIFLFSNSLLLLKDDLDIPYFLEVFIVFPFGFIMEQPHFIKKNAVYQLITYFATLVILSTIFVIIPFPLLFKVLNITLISISILVSISTIYISAFSSVVKNDDIYYLLDKE